MEDSMSLANRFTPYAASKLKQSFAQIQRCLDLLTSDQVWSRPNDVSNAVGNLVLHLNGNIRQWILSALAGESYERDRPAEFSQRKPSPTDAILADLQETVERAREVLSALNEQQLAAELTIQGYNVTGMEAVFHAVEHFSLHTGQIVYATKILTGKDLSLYDAHGQRLDGRDQGAL
ncbi:MAG: hypothetical protein CMJ48_07555 [Planctomycetaceae bacterium]|nr:hypothetical protein [Planctomycetaceae bacterium]